MSDHRIHWQPGVEEIVAREVADLMGRVATAERKAEQAKTVADSMAAHARMAWRSASAREGLSDHEALVQHADAMSRWSGRIYMALNGRIEGGEEWLRAALADPKEKP